MSDPSDHRLVLVVEDNPANLLLTQAILRRAGYQSASAKSAEEALDYLGETRPDVILMDVQLPGLDGLSLTRQLKGNPRFRGVPIIALTAFAMKDDRERALSAGCDGYIAKPINTRTFAGELAAILQAHQANLPH